MIQVSLPHPGHDIHLFSTCVYAHRCMFEWLLDQVALVLITWLCTQHLHHNCVILFKRTHWITTFYKEKRLGLMIQAPPMSWHTFGLYMTCVCMVHVWVIAMLDQVAWVLITWVCTQLLHLYVGQVDIVILVEHVFFLLNKSHCLIVCKHCVIFYFRNCKIPCQNEVWLVDYITRILPDVQQRIHIYYDLGSPAKNMFNWLNS